MPMYTFEVFAKLADKHKTPKLAGQLRMYAAQGAFLEIAEPDPRPQLNRFRQALEQLTGLQCSYDQSFKTWSYGTESGQMIEEFLRLDHALLAAVRHLITPVERFAVRLATREDWTWLNTFRSGSNGSRRFTLFEDTRYYWHVPNANMLLLSYTEPQEFGRNEPALAGFCFFGSGVVGVIESRYRGGGAVMMRWLQSQFAELIAHHVLSDVSAQFLQRYGFVDVAPPLPAAGVTEVQAYLRQQRALFETATERFGTGHRDFTPPSKDGRQRIMVWPASTASNPEAIAAKLSSAGLSWWYTTKSDRQHFDHRTHEQRAVVCQVVCKMVSQASGFCVSAACGPRRRTRASSCPHCGMPLPSSCCAS